MVVIWFWQGFGSCFGQNIPKHCFKFHHFCMFGKFKVYIFLKFWNNWEDSKVIALFEKKYPTVSHPSTFIASSGWVCIFGKIRILLNVLKTSLFVLSLVSAK